MKLVNKALVAGLVALLSAPVVLADETTVANTPAPAVQATTTVAPVASNPQMATSETAKKKEKAHKGKKHKKEEKTETKTTTSSENTAPASN